MTSTIANVRATVPELTPTGILVASHLAEAGAADYRRLAEAAGCCESSVSKTLQTLADQGLVTLSKRDTDRRGPGLSVATATPALEEAGDATDGPRPAVEGMQSEILAALAVGHYLEGRSTMKAKQIAPRIGREVGELSSALAELRKTGAIEDPLDGNSPGRWRLVGAHHVTPFYASEVDDGDD